MSRPMEKLRASFRTRAWRGGAYSVLAAVLVIAMAVVANLAVSALPVSSTQLDMTENQLYSISPGTEQVLASLDRDVDIYWLVQTGYENTTMEQVLAKYAEYDHVSVTQVDPVRYPGFAAAYTDETVTDNSVAVVCGQQSMYIPYEELWTYSDYELYAYYLNYYGQQYLDVFAGEEKLTGAVLYVTSDQLPVLYYLTGHGETGVSESVLTALSLESIQTRSLNLVTEGAVPADCSALAIFGPERDISDDELKLLRAYADRGGRLLVTTAWTAQDTPNLARLLDDFGIELVGGCVMESDSRYYRYYNLSYVDMILPTLGSHTVTAPLLAQTGGSTVIMPDAQAMLDASDGRYDVTVTALLTSSATSYVKQDVEGLTSFDKTDGDETGPFMVAAAAENSETDARLAVFGSTRFMEAEFSDLVSGANLDLFLNGADWLTGREQSISIHPKTLTGEYLTFTDSGANILKGGMIVLVPVLFLAAGVAIFVKRRRR